MECPYSRRKPVLLYWLWTLWSRYGQTTGSRLYHSMSILQALYGRKWENPVILDILTRLHRPIEDGSLIYFIWVPNHISIKGNTDADTATRVARQFPDVGFKVSYTDFKQQINTFINSRWQLAWDTENQNKLHSIQPQVGTCVGVRGLSRREERVLHRARIGHTYLTHAYHLRETRRFVYRVWFR